MERYSWRNVLYLIVVLLGSRSVVWAADKAADEIPITVQIRNYAHVPPHVVTKAETIVKEIFSSIGIRTVFVECEPADSELCSRSGDIQPRLNVHFLSRSFLHQDGDAMGVAEKNHRTAHIFYDHIDGFVRGFETEPAISSSLGFFLGCIVAHEIGHLLLSNTVDHRAGTLMRATWSERDVREVQLHGTRIRKDQAAMMRKTLAGLR